MKLKELERPAVQVWSPASQYPLYLATGTSAQQLDSSFSTNGTLEIFEVDFRDPSLDLKRKGVLSASSRGILSVSWSQADAELLLSSAKDSQILCWNLGSSEVVYKLPTQSSWCFDVQWCPRDPSVFSAASFDGWISLYSVMGRSWEVQHMRQADKISSSFSKGQPLPPLQVPEQVAQVSLIPPLKKPPRWIRRPTGVSFAFGGKLVTFGLPSTPACLVSQPCSRLVFVSQVTTESEFLLRSTELQEALRSGNLLTYCENKSQQALLQSEKMLWQFLKVTLEQDSRMKFLKLLGYSKDELQTKVATWLKSGVGLGESPQPKGNDLSSDRQQVSCSQTSKHTTEEASASSAFFDELVPQNMTPWEIPITKDVDGLLSQALLLGELGPAVELCLKEERFADAIILAQAGGADLLKRTQERYLAQKKTKVSSLLACVVQKNWKDVVCTCSLKNWREALALLLTYSGPEKFPELCDMLGTRMEQEGGRALTSEAQLCYVCSGTVERLVECWAKCQQALSPMALQDLMEKVMVLNRGLELLRGPLGVSPGPATTYRVTQYANLLAAQGSLATAMSFLPSDCAQPPVQQLRERLFHAQGFGHAVLGKQSPPFPFPRIVVGATHHSKETSSYSSGSQPSPQVPALSPRPRLFSPQSSPVMPLTPSHPNPYQAPRTQNISDYRALGSQAVQPLPLGPGVRPASSQPQLLGGQRAQAPHPVGFPGTWPLPGSPLPMASPDIMQPGSTSLPETPRLFPLLPVRPPGPSHMVSHTPAPPASFPMSTPPGGPGAPCSSVLPTTGVMIPYPGSQDSWKDAPASRGNLQTNKLPETCIPPAPITAPVMSLTPELRESLPSQPPVSGVSHAPPRASGERSLQRLQQLPPEKVERKELPPEHQSLKTSFEALLQRCSLSATDLKTKRKLEEAAQRLECLYEKLCEGTLSPHVVAGLHEVARCVDAGSFEQGLAVHAQVAGCSSFSEVSSFMPILKAVLTIAHKLQV
nr:protein transport protein Sec31B isoform X4 [Saimiri boliviensis boliviensis]